jgi:hypothetical protein
VREHSAHAIACSASTNPMRFTGDLVVQAVAGRGANSLRSWVLEDVSGVVGDVADVDVGVDVRV